MVLMLTVAPVDCDVILLLTFMSCAIVVLIVYCACHQSHKISSEVLGFVCLLVLFFCLPANHLFYYILLKIKRKINSNSIWDMYRYIGIDIHISWISLFIWVKFIYTEIHRS